MGPTFRLRQGAICKAPALRHTGRHSLGESWGIPLSELCSHRELTA
jgi:hypothetical protein